MVSMCKGSRSQASSGGRDTDAVSISDWSSFRLLPLLQDPNFNTSKTLILVTFDEFTLPCSPVSSYIHYPTISTVENLGNLGRQNTDKTLAKSIPSTPCRTRHRTRVAWEVMMDRRTVRIMLLYQ